MNSFRVNYPFLNLEIVENSNSWQKFQFFTLETELLMQKLFKGGNYSRAETI